MKMKQTFLTLLLTLLISGCIGTTKPKIESWYYTPPRDTATTLYGVGDGASFKSAKVDALASISSNLSVTLQSNYEKSDQAVRSDGSERTLQEIRHTIKTQAKKISFSKVDIIKEQVIEKRVYLLVSVNRARLYAEHQRKLDAQMQKIERDITASQSLSSLERFIALKQFHDTSSTLIATVAVLRAINSRRDLSNYENTIAKYEKAYLKSKSSLKLHVKSSRESQMFKLALQKSLMNMGVKLVQDGADGVVELKFNSKKERLMGYNIEKCFLHVKLSNSQKSIIASKDYVVVGKSKIDFSQSHHNCVTKFSTRIDNEGLFESLGI
ncbi:MAG: LPP20 family lipoprotein [Campylobacterota bacterium]|nr:LPP20 family lipoprotein [Campylobacterota bacterium]